MEDTFTAELFEMARNSPAIRQAIVNAMSKDKGYSIPIGDITIDLYAREESPQRDFIEKALLRARSLTVKDLAQMLGELSAYLTIKEEAGEKLQPHEKTLKDIDIYGLALFILVMWVAHIRHQKGDTSSDNQ